MAILTIRDVDDELSQQLRAGVERRSVAHHPLLNDVD